MLGCFSNLSETQHIVYWHAVNIFTPRWRSASISASAISFISELFYLRCGYHKVQGLLFLLRGLSRKSAIHLRQRRTISCMWTFASFLVFRSLLTNDFRLKIPQNRTPNLHPLFLLSIVLESWILPELAPSTVPERYGATVSL
jgi:hypothetical protein